MAKLPEEEQPKISNTEREEVRDISPSLVKQMLSTYRRRNKAKTVPKELKAKRLKVKKTKRKISHKSRKINQHKNKLNKFQK